METITELVKEKGITKQIFQMKEEMEIADYKNKMMDLKNKIINQYSIINHYPNDPDRSYCDWHKILRNEDLDEKFFDFFMYDTDLNINKYVLSQFVKLSENFIRKYKNDVIWTRISHHQKLSIDFIIEFENEICFYDLSYNKYLDLNIIRLYPSKIEYNNIFYAIETNVFINNITEEDMNEFQEDIDLYHQRLTDFWRNMI